MTTRCFSPPDRRIEHAFAERVDTHAPKGRCNELMIGGSVLLEQRLVRSACHQDDLAHGECRLARAFLEHDSQVTGKGARREIPDVSTVDRDVSGVRLDDAVDTSQQARLAAAVGPDQADEGAARTRQCDIDEDSGVSTVHDTSRTSSLTMSTRSVLVSA